MGELLGITSAELRAIQMNVGPGGDCKRYFSAVLTKWRETRRKPYTWQTVLDVLSSPYVGQAHLASDIQQLLLDKHQH